MLPPDPEWVKRVEILRSDPENKEAKEWIARFLKERYGE
jgi:hypothetical protein